jgi:hypothetical protein
METQNESQVYEAIASIGRLPSATTRKERSFILVCTCCPNPQSHLRLSGRGVR